MSLKCLVTGTAGFIGSHLAERLKGVLPGSKSAPWRT